MFGIYDFWEDGRVIIVCSLIIAMLMYFIMWKLTNGFKCTKLIIFIPTLLCLVGVILGVLMMFLSKDGILQHVFLCVATYSLLTLIITGIVGLIILWVKRR